MRIALLFGLGLASIAGSSRALADDKSDCVKAASQGQALRDDHKLVEAREQFRTCARQVCPAVIRRDCTTWLDASERNLPTVVPSARTAAGLDLVDVVVRVDGAPLVTKLDGQALPMNPGLHTFHFARPDGRAVDQSFVIKQGVQNQSVAVVFPGPPAAPAPASEAPGSSPTSTPRDAEAPPASPSSSSGPYTTIGFVLGGLGLAGLGASAVLGALAIQDKNAAHCDASGACDPGPLGDARTMSTGSTIAFAAGGLLLAGGIALVVFAPKADGAQSGRLTAIPVVGAGIGGFDVQGSF